MTTEDTIVTKAITLKDDIVDAWYEDADGETLNVEVIVPKDVQEAGGEAVGDYVQNYVSDNFDVPSFDSIGFTQTW